MNPDAVVVDTNVFGATLTASAGKSAILASYRQHLSGRKLVVSFQTVAELRFGALNAKWGSVRQDQLELRLKMAVMIPPHDQLTQVWAELKHECKGLGHGLAHPNHTADLWIGATALSLGLPLVSNDAIFKSAPGITLITEL